MGADHKGLRALMKGALRLVYPPQCLCCNAPVAVEGGLCPDCWQETDFLGGTCCDDCGAPLPGDGTPADGAIHCDECLATPRPWQQGRAALTYRGTGRKLALMLKHGDRLDVAGALGDWLSDAATPLVVPGMVVAPVPLHLRRLFHRRYNQAELLAGRIAHRHGLQPMPGLLQRSRHTPSQDHRGVAERFANLADAIQVRPRLAPQIAGRPVLLVDDVMASGATLATCAQALLDAGSGPISVAVLARAVKDA